MPDMGLSMGGIGANMLFSILLGIVVVGWKRAVLYYAISAAVVAVIENLTFYTGFPFGYYIPLEGGPKILAIPLLVCVGYFNYAMLAWVMADLILPMKSGASGSYYMWGRVFISLIIGSAIDLINDPMGVLTQGMWYYPSGGGFYGVPFSNSFGWLVTMFITILIWEKILSMDSGYNNGLHVLRFSRWQLITAVLMGIQIIPLYTMFRFFESYEVTDCTGQVWTTGGMYEALALLALHTTVFFMVIGVISYMSKKDSSDIQV